MVHDRENIVAVEDAGIRAYVPLTDFEHRSAFFGRDVFTYDAERDQYCCPQGHPLLLARSKRTEAVVVYRADSAICNACPLKVKCTTSDRGRTIQRSIYEDYLDGGGHGGRRLARVVDRFSDQIVKYPHLNLNPALKEWNTTGQPPGAKFMRTLWLCHTAGGPVQYTGKELGGAHAHPHITSDPKCLCRTPRKRPSSETLPPGLRSLAFGSRAAGPAVS